MKRGWMHHQGLFGMASPVEVLSKGPKRARVRLVHRLRWNRKWIEAGTVRTVPADCLGDAPWPGALIGVGRSRFVPQPKPEARAMVKRWGAKA